MADINSGLGWSEAQWEKVNRAVTEAFEKASVAGAFVPCYGPLPSSAEYVRNEQLDARDEGATVVVTDDSTLKLFNLTVKVELSSEQVADDALSTALLAFRRAANTLAQVEDDIVFNGFDKAGVAIGAPPGGKTVADARADRDSALRHVQALKGDRISVLKPIGSAPEITGTALKPNDVAGKQTDDAAKPTPTDDVADALRKLDNAEKQLQTVERHERVSRNRKVAVTAPEDGADGLAKVNLGTKEIRVVTLRARGIDVGEELVTAVVRAIADLEDHSHSEPFACLLGSNLFDEAHRPVEKSLVLPADRIIPLLKGPLLRSGQMDKDTGIVVSLAGTDIDIVVATAPKVQFLQVREDAKYLFRVYEKFRLRIKDDTAVQPLLLSPVIP